MYQRPTAGTYVRVLGDLFIDAMPSSEFRIKFHPPPSLFSLGPSERANRGRKEGESERLSHQLIKSLTADSSWGLAAAAAAAGKQTSHGARKTAAEGEKHDAKSAVFVPR